MTSRTFTKSATGSEAYRRIPTINELVDLLAAHLDSKIPCLDERLQAAAMSAIRSGRRTMCDYPEEFLLDPRHEGAPVADTRVLVAAE